MEERLQDISNAIRQIPGINVEGDFTVQGVTVIGKIVVEVDGTKLPFEVNVFHQYPYQFHDTETIKFINKDLLEYNHVMKDGHICIHTTNNPDLIEKLKTDFDSLKQWINKYYLKKEGDPNYEHIIVPNGKVDGLKHHFLFTQVDHTFRKGEFGFFRYGFLSNGLHAEEYVNTYLVKKFETRTANIECKWNTIYKGIPEGHGLFVFIEDAPVENRRFAVESWADLEQFVDQSFFDFLKTAVDKVGKSDRDKPLFVLIGYQIPGDEIFWQCVAVDVKNPPNYGEKLPGSNVWAGKFYDEVINWMYTHDSSYKYFFGRGALHSELTDKKILIVGLGAVGSQLATSLVRGGCKHIGLTDYDIKEPENVCRSEYGFKTGLTGKVLDLSRMLNEISPFVEIDLKSRLTDAIKEYINSGKVDGPVRQVLEEYDIIFDCSTDNDLAHIIDRLNPKCTVINLSITNHAAGLVCAVSPDLFYWMNHMFYSLKNDVTDLYNPTGCWSPTFKASYTDISMLIQQALAKINLSFEKKLPFRNFVLEKEINDNITFNYKQF